MWGDPEKRAKIIAAQCDNPELRSPKRKAQLDAARLLRGPMRDATRELIRMARMRQTFPQKMTGIEQALFDGFTVAGLSFEMHKTMFGRWQPDFVFQASHLVVQADGDYWHSKPVTAASDARFNAAAAAAGWRVIRFLGSAIKADCAACVASVVAALQEYSAAA